jgi:hypothetical protein
MLWRMFLEAAARVKYSGAENWTMSLDLPFGADSPCLPLRLGARQSLKDENASSQAQPEKKPFALTRLCQASTAWQALAAGIAAGG